MLEHVVVLFYSFSSSEEEEEEDNVQYQSSNPNTPVYDIPKTQYSAEKIINMLLDPGDQTLICQVRPT